MTDYMVTVNYSGSFIIRVKAETKKKAKDKALYAAMERDYLGGIHMGNVTARKLVIKATIVEE